MDPTQFAPGQGPMPMPGMDDPTQGAVGPPMSLAPPGGGGMPPQRPDLAMMQRIAQLRQQQQASPIFQHPMSGSQSGANIIQALMKNMNNVAAAKQFAPQPSPTPNSADPTMAGLFGPMGPGSQGGIS